MTQSEATVPARLLDDVRASMKELLAQNVNAWGEVDRLHEQFRGAVEALRLACTVDGKLGYRTAGGIRQDMPKDVERAVRAAIGGQ